MYSDDKRLIRARIEKEYGHVLDARQIKQLLGMKFKDWGNLSKSFLELQGVSKEDGEYRSLLQALWETNDNLMELMGERYTYKEELDKLTNKAEKPLCEWTIDDLEGLYLSPSVKRMVWQTVKVLNEIIYVFLTIFLYLLKCPQSLILSALRAFCFCGKPHISRSIFLYFRYQAWLKSW